MCLSALNLAARYADPGLATSAIRIISSRRTSLTSYHYEALLEAYIGSDDLKTTFRILVIMSKAGIEPDIKTTRPLFLYLSQFVFRPEEAWGVLESMHQDGHNIPVGAVNVILEANVKFENVESSIDFYKQLHTICASGPNTETFNILFQALSREGSKDMAMFLAAEMRALNVKPDHLTYDRLILICLQEADYGDAFLYLQEMEKVGLTRGESWWMRAGTVIAFVRRCVAEKDKRVWELLSEMGRREFSVTERLKTWVEDNWAKEEVTPWNHIPQSIRI
jgi:pentatricopeptide repeat protein